MFNPLVSQAKDDLVGHNLEKEMRAVVEKGIMQGYGNNVYGPEDPVTRAQFATLIARALELPPGPEGIFTDLPEDYNANLLDGIYRTAQSGIVNGYEDSTFRPDNKITREEMALMVDRALKFKDIERIPVALTFTDTNQINVNAEFRNAVAHNVYFGIIRGIPVNNNQLRFGPKDTATRAHAAAFLHRLLHVIDTGGQTTFTYRVGTISNEGNVTFNGTGYMTFAEAERNITNKETQAIYLGDRIVKMNRGQAVAQPHNGSGVVSVFQSNMTTQLTYVAPGTEMKYLDADKDKVKVQVANTTGFVRANEVKLIPTQLMKGQSYFQRSNGDLNHHIYNPLTNTYSAFLYGPAPSFIQAGQRYYSVDGYTFTDASGKSVGTAYQYFNFLPLRSKTNYTAEQLDSYIAHMKATVPRIADSPLEGLGEVFKEAEETFGINALYLFAKAIHESDWGISKIANERKNLFGYGAYDRDPLGNAMPFETFEHSIMFVAESMHNRYLTPTADGTFANPQTCTYNTGTANERTVTCGQMYRGGILGNKSIGMNVNYASDPYWGQKIAGHMYRADRFLGGTEYNHYQLGITHGYDPVLNVRHEPNTNLPAQYWYRGIGHYVAMLESINQGNATWYKIISDHKDFEFGYVHGSYLRQIPIMK